MHLAVELIEIAPAPWLERELHTAVREHALTERRHRFDPLLRVGMPSGAREELVLDSSVRAIEDAALREDVLRALVVSQIPRVDERGLVLWLIRPGDLEPCDLELRWASALRAVAETGGSPSQDSEKPVRTRFVVCNKRAWVDPLTRVGRSWQRIRQRRPTASTAST